MSDLTQQKQARELAALLPGLGFPKMEQGTFVPTWVGATIAGAFTYTASATLIEWTRIGNRLFYNGRIVISAIGTAPTGALSIAGWPYPGVSDSGMAIAGGGPFIAWAMNVAAGYTDLALNMTNGSSLASVVRSGDNVAIGAVLGGELIVGDCRVEGSYRVA